jgi:trk system potassium uptake protein TrkA
MMNVVIAGAGKVGYFLAKELMEENEVTIIDSNEKAIKNIEETLDVLPINGDVEDPNSYLHLKKDIDLFIAVTDSDEVNLLSSLIIDNIVHVNEKIVRLKNNFFLNDQIKAKLGISKMIIPAFEVAKTFHHLIDFPHANNIKTFDYTKALLLSIRASDTLEKIMIKTLRKEFDNQIIIAGIEREDKFFIPNEFDVILAKDLIYVFAFPWVIDDLRISVCEKGLKQATKNCLIYGANQLGIEIAKVLSQKDLNIKLIDKSLENCECANSILKNSVEILKSNYNLDLVLDKYGENTDIFIAATTNDEFNITKCIEAKQKNIKKVIGIHNNRQYAAMMRKLGIEVIRGEKMHAFYSILEKITSSRIVTQRAFCGGEGDALLRKIFPNSLLIGNKLPIDSKMGEKAIFYVQREDKFLHHLDALEIQDGDIIVAFSKETNTKSVIECIK